MCPTVSPSSWQPYFIYPPRVKIELHLPVLSALFTGHGAHRQAAVLETPPPGSRLPRAEKRYRQSIWLTNLPYRGVVSRVLQIHPLPPSCPPSLTPWLTLCRAACCGVHPGVPNFNRAKRGGRLHPRGPSGKCVRSLPTPRLLTARNAPVMVYKVVRWV